MPQKIKVYQNNCAKVTIVMVEKRKVRQF